MADENVAPVPPPTDIDVAPPPDDPRVDHVLHSEVNMAMTAQSIKDRQNATSLDLINPAWIAQQKINMREVRYKTIADYQARKAKEAKDGQE